METFFDGGLFELIIFFAFATLFNFIFLRKYLLIVYSVIAVGSPVILFFIHKTELYYWLVTICCINSLLMVIVLWMEKLKHPEKLLFDLTGLKRNLIATKDRLIVLFKKNLRFRREQE
jgi:hypothetical protein